jgi:predicted transposase YbfD/YdcC
MERSIIEILTEIPDYRKGNAIRHKLEDILSIGLLSTICNGNTFSDMALFGDTHEKELKGFLELPYGIPSHDTFEDVFAKLEPKALSVLFEVWTEELKAELMNAGIAIDGKTIRRSRGRNKKAIHVVTAFASELQLVLGQLATDEKSNEITAIPKLLEMFCVKGKIITIDAMGAQTDIAEKIIEKEGDYILALKGNQQNLMDDVSFYLDNETVNQSKKQLIEGGLYEKTMEKGHGRIETRECFLCPEIDWLDGRKNWAGLKGIGVIISKREEIGKEPSFVRHYFLYSIENAKAAEILRIKRSHWAIENSLHWMLDVTFREDDCRARTLNAAENLNVLRKQALQFMKSETSSKLSMRQKRLRCAYDFSYALKVLGIV